jgi:hypothetical protein
MLMRRFITVLTVAAAVVPSVLAQPQDRAAKVRADRDRFAGFGDWIYNDLPAGVAAAKDSGKPLLVVLRCIPCEACAQLDERVVKRDPAVRALLDRFVCVRIVHANGLDLSLFQYDYDQSWAAFLLNADLTIYGRYGTRSHRTRSEDDVSLEGFAKVLQGALDLHAQYPKNKAALAGKRGPAVAVKAPEEFPTLRGRYKPTIDYAGQVVQSCIHCHQVGEALRRVSRDAGQPIPDKLLYPYPNPKALGLVLDPKERATVKAVTPGSPAERDGFRPGDAIATLDGQPLLSIADVQWLLHNTGDTGVLKAEVRRAGQAVPLTLTLDPGWRRRDDISWRASSWDLRRMTTGGLTLEDLPTADRREAGLADGALALRVKYVGQFGAHAAAKQAGFQKDDVIVTVNGRSDRMTEGDWMATLAQKTRPGDRVAVTVLRGGQKVDLTLPMQ